MSREKLTVVSVSIYQCYLSGIFLVDGIKIGAAPAVVVLAVVIVVVVIIGIVVILTLGIVI